MAHTTTAAAEAVKDEWDTSREFHESLLLPEYPSADHISKAFAEQCRTLPLFSVDVARSIRSSSTQGRFPQYALLAAREKAVKPSAVSGSSEETGMSSLPPDTADRRIFLNLNVGSSTFVCGSQGSGKSHTLSCMLESGLQPSALGKLPNPLTGIVFHWDKFASPKTYQPCEAAYLCSEGIPVTVLVSPSNYSAMKATYDNLALARGSKLLKVRPLLLREKHLNVDRMMKLMAVGTDGQRSSLYMEVVCKKLREIVSKNGGTPDDLYSQLTTAINIKKEFKFQTNQSDPLGMRLDLLKYFLEEWQGGKFEPGPDIWAPRAGSLTIVDLTDQFVDASAACTLFDICLTLFLETQTSGQTMIALDEAHKYMSEGGSSAEFTESLLSVIRLQRHLGTRIIISTQEPTVSPKLLDLCSMTIVHRFTSPSWLDTLKAHLAGVNTFGDSDAQQALKEIWETIVNLDVGQALLFSPSAMLDVCNSKPQKLGTRYVKIGVRQRRTADGGRSVSAT
ncbi:MAG: hypothetical protein Q9174_004111 [Haloplaca sp. 1 TL-2023]